MANNVVKKRVFGYLLSFLLGWAAIILFSSLVIGDRISTRPDALPLKLRNYAKQAEQYDLIFIGDSRTYCGFHPEIIDPLLGSNSINLATWANWLPTQYLFVKDLIPQIPPGTTVVWTIGKSNLSSDSFRDRYPLSFEDVVLFYNLDLPLSDIQTAWLSHNPVFTFLLKRKAIYNRIVSLANRALPTIPGFAYVQSPRAEVASEQQSSVVTTHPPESVLNVLVKETLYDSGNPTSIGYTTKEGGYCRYELDRDFFKSKEKSRQFTTEEIAAFKPNRVSPSMDYLLKESLKQFHEAGIKLVLNVIEDSPYNYGRSPVIREQWKQHLLQYLRQQAAPYSFPVLDVDQSEILDDDYFDHNHLNFRGIKKFAVAFTNVAKPHINGAK